MEALTFLTPELKSFLSDYGYVLLVAGIFLVGQILVKFLFFRGYPSEASEFEEARSCVFSPLDMDERSYGPQHLRYPLGRHILSVSSRYFLLSFFAIFCLGILYAGFIYSGARETSLPEKAVYIGIIGAAVIYVLFQMTKGIDLYERGMILRNILGHRMYLYDDLSNLYFTSERISKSSQVWFVWRVPVVVLRFRNGKTISLSGLYYSQIKEKMKKLEQNLVYEEKGR